MAIMGFTPVKPFKFWVQKVLPSVYDDSLSYYELLNKVVDYLNEMGEDVNALGDAVEDYIERFNELKTFVDTYFDNLDVQEEINAKLDEMATNGELLDLVTPYIDSHIPEEVTAWLESNITPTTPAVDKSLSVAAAASDALTTGNALNRINGAMFSSKSSVVYPVIVGGFRTDGTYIDSSNRAITGYIKLNTGCRIVLDSDQFNIFSIWCYTGDPAHPATAVPSSHPFEPAPDRYGSRNVAIINQTGEETMFRVCFAHNDITEDMTEQDLEDLSAAFNLYVRTDKTFTKEYVPADAKRTGEVVADVYSAISNLQAACIPVNRGAKYSITQGGIDSVGQPYPYTYRARTNYIRVNGVGKLSLTTDAYLIWSVWTYTGDPADASTAVPSRHILFPDDAELANNQVAVALLPTETMVRVSFAKKDGLEDTLVDADFAAINAAFTVLKWTDLTLTARDMPADSYTVGNILNGYANVASTGNSLPSYADAIAKWDALTANGILQSGESLTFVEESETYTIKSYKILFDNKWINTTEFPYSEYGYEENNETEAPFSNLFDKPNMLIVSGQHGNEKQTPWALYEFVVKLCTLPEYAELRGQYNWYFVPIVNPYGYVHNIRGCNASNLDPNLEYRAYLSSLIAEEPYEGNPCTKFLGDMAMERKYAMVIDLHQNPNLVGGGGPYQTAYYRDYMCGYADVGGLSGFLIKKVAGCFARVEQKLNHNYNKPNTQTLFITTTNAEATEYSTTSGSFRSFCRNKLYVTVAGSDRHTLGEKRADYCALLETSTRSYFYTQNNTANNSESLVITNQIVDAFLKTLAANCDTDVAVHNTTIANADELIPCPVS